MHLIDVQYYRFKNAAPLSFIDTAEQPNASAFRRRLAPVATDPSNRI
jgi:hypothetical protein